MKNYTGQRLVIIFLQLNISIWLLMQSAWGQSVSEIKNSDDIFLWGEGSGGTLKSADDAALEMLISQISVKVNSTTELNKTQTTNNLTNNYNASFSSVIKTYTQATLTNTKRIVLENEPDAKVLRYIRISELDKIFQARENKIKEYAKSGHKAMKEYKAADALRNFYWGLTLLRSHPKGGSISFIDEKGQEQLLRNWFDLQINGLLSDLKIEINEIQDKGTYNLYILNLKLNGQNASNLSYSYWSGQDWSNIITAKDGIGYVELEKGSIPEQIKLKIEYIFESESTIDRELNEVLKELEPVPYRKSYITISNAPKIETNADTKPISNMSTNSANSSINLNSVENATDYNKIIETLINSISTKQYYKAESLFTQAGFGVFQKLIQYGHAQILGNYELVFLRYGEFVLCRSIPMSFKFSSNNREFVEDVVIHFNKEKEICNLTFSLTDQAQKDIFSITDWDERDRIMIVNFLENYQTAYALKRLDYIEQIFSDDALIITGYYVRNGLTQNRYSENNVVKYNRYSKTEYINRLKYTFNSNEFINLRLADNTVRRSAKSDSVYGIQIKQDYFSSNYGDSGYLFLLVDLSNKEMPTIQVRTWQPEKNKDGSIIGITDF